MKILCLADVQIGSLNAAGHKVGLADRMLQARPDVVLYPGDLTHNGTAGGWKERLALRLLRRDDHRNQWGLFYEKYVEPFESRGARVFLCEGAFLNLTLGNHDKWKYWGGYRPVMRQLKKRGEAGKYTVTYKGVKFICSGEYPDPEFLSAHVPMHAPSVVFWHRPPVGPHCVSKQLADDVASALRSRNCITVTGHYHRSMQGRGWDPLIRWWKVGGSQFLEIEYDQELTTAKCTLHGRQPPEPEHRVQKEQVLRRTRQWSQ